MLPFQILQSYVIDGPCEVVKAKYVGKSIKSSF